MADGLVRNGGDNACAEANHTLKEPPAAAPDPAASDGLSLSAVHFEGCLAGELSLARSEVFDVAGRLRRAFELQPNDGCAVADPVIHCRLVQLSAPDPPSPRLRQPLAKRQRIAGALLSGLRAQAGRGELRRSSRTLARLKVSGQSFVAEVTTEKLRRAALELLLSKPTFLPERHLVRRRVFQNTSYVCRTYVLIDGALGQKSKGEQQNKCYLSALTIRINAYTASQPCASWAQVLNICARNERKGHGSKLLREVERIVCARDGVDVIVCYPVDRDAELFWTAMGFSKRKESFLSAEELVPVTKGGKLIIEARGGNGAVLSRWEKQEDPGKSATLGEPKIPAVGAQ